MKTRKEILEALISGQMDIQEAERALDDLSITEVGGLAAIDMGRHERSGIPEVVMAQSKSAEAIVEITKTMVESIGYALLSRMDRPKVKELETGLTGVEVKSEGTDEHLTVLVHAEKWDRKKDMGKIGVITAGTSDIAYAKEVEGIASVMGVEVLSFYDVGVAGIHRIVEPIKKIREESVDAVVVLAGMEGALPTVVASLVDVPVIGVPIPTGYGFGGKGETALASMLQSCAPGLAVVNIGNGIGAGSLACLIASRCAKARKET